MPTYMERSAEVSCWRTDEDLTRKVGASKVAAWVAPPLAMLPLFLNLTNSIGWCCRVLPPINRQKICIPPHYFMVARQDANAGGLRLPRIQTQFEKAPPPKEMIVLEGAAHAQALFETDQADRVMREILRFLSSQ